MGSRGPRAAHARAVASQPAVRELGLPTGTVSQALAISPTAVVVGVARRETLLTARGLSEAQLLPRL